MPDLTKDTKWYSVNFSNENVLQGQQTQFLRIKNLSDSVNINDPKNIYVMPIIELIGMDNSLSYEELKEKYSNQIFFNGADIFKLNEIFKNENNYTIPQANSLNVLWYGGPKNHDNPEDFAQVFPDTSGLNLGNTTANWIGAPIAGIDGPYTSPAEKINFRIDYTGNVNLTVKITFFLTTANPAQSNFWTEFPLIVTDLSSRIGDIRKIPGEFQHYDGTSWQSFTGVTLEEPIYGIKHLHQEGYFLPGGPNDHWHDYQEVYLFCYKKNDIKPSRNKEYWLEKEIISKRIYEEKSTHMLLRTNPKLSGNVKVVIDDSSNMFLDTIEANESLSHSKFKRNKVNANGNYITDLKRFFSSLNSEVMYDVFQKDRQYLSSKTAYSDQYDFFYGYGASQVNSKYYNEQFKLFAPLWVKDKLPEFFVIFKGDGPYNPGTYENLSKKEILQELFKNSKIIKTYDLRDQSNIGTYFSTLIKDQRFKKMPLNINYEKDTLSVWNGIDYRQGVLGEKGEYLHDFFKTDRAIIDFDEFITNGFERNELLCPNLINFEFLFYDEEATDFEINRYFGFYVNSVDLADTEIFTPGFQNIPNQNPIPVNNFDIAPYSRKQFNQTNENGIVIPVDYFQGSELGEPIHKGNTRGLLPINEHVLDTNRFFFIQGKNSQFYRIKGINDYFLGNENASNKKNYTGIQIYDKEINIGNFTGIVKLKNQIKSEILNSGNSQLVINLQNLDNRGLIFEEGEVLEFEYVDINQNLQKWKCTANSTGLQSGDAWNYPVYDYSNLVFENNFNPSGDINDVANALVKCINSFENGIIFAYQENGELILKSTIGFAAGNGIIFRRKLVNNSVFDNSLFYSIKPHRKKSLDVTEKSLDAATTGDIVKFELKNHSLRNEFYKIIITDTGINALGEKYITLRIYVNDGFLEEKSLVLHINKETVNFKNNLFTISFKSTENGLSLDYTQDDEWTYAYKNQIISQRFVGGVNRNRSRAKIDTIDAQNIDNLDWFQVQKDKYSRLKLWEIQGENLSYLYNLENGIVDSGNKIIEYKDLKEKSIIQIENTLNEFYISLDKKIVSFETYKPKVGLMSFMPIKDFDFDFITSDYAYTPSAEIFNYFGTINLSQSEEQELDLGQNYEILSGEVELYGRSSVTGDWEPIEITQLDIWNTSANYVRFSPNNVKNFNTHIPSYYYENDKILSNKLDSTPTTITQSYFYRTYKALEEISSYDRLKIIALEDSVITKSVYNNDKDLSNFTGFLGISDFISVEDEEQLQQLIEDDSIDRFFFEQLISEYDRLRENFNKDYAVKSRVVPFINKWVNSGTDCRDNPYRLNNSYAFGLTGFSPDNEINEKNPSLHTHEFYYLDEFPENYASEFLQNSRSYFFENISDDNVILENGSTNWLNLFKNIDQDWFMKYFCVGYPVEKSKDGQKIIKKSEERYVFLNYIPGVERSQCIFRGCKIEVQDININNQEENIGSLKYSDYKFSAILRIKNLQTNVNNNPRKIEFIANEKYKSIVMVITLYINDYKIQNSGYGYAFLYSANDALRSTGQKNQNMLYSDTSGYAHWNDGTDDIIGGFETQRHYNSFLGTSIIDFADVKLSGIFNTNVFNTQFPKELLAISNTTQEFSPLNEISPVNGNIYNKREYYNILEDNEVINNAGNIHIDSLERGEFAEFSQYIPNFNNNENYIINNQAGKDQNIQILDDRIIIDQKTNLTYSTSSRIGTSVTFPTRRKFGSPSINLQNSDSSLWYLSAGEEYLNKRITQISFAEIFDSVNLENEVEFTSILKDGKEIKNAYKIKFIPFDTIVKNNTLGIEEDTDKPDQFKEYGVIGFNIVNNDNQLETIYRHRGRFEPKTRKLLDFWIREDESMTNHFNKDFLLANTRFLIESEFFGDMSNLFYTKISDESIVKLSNTSEYQSLYPLADEIVIDNKDFFTFSSNWDNNYYDFYQFIYGSLQTSNSETITEKIEGTFELKENKSFFGSKLMKTPNILSIETFNSDEINFSLINTNSISDIPQLLDTSSTDINDGKQRIIININTENILLRSMIENNAVKEFLKIKQSGNTRFANLTNEEITDICKEYLKKNILNLFKVDKITLYAKPNALEITDQLFRTDLDDDQKRFLGYKETKNTNLIKLDRFNYEINQVLDSKNFKSYSISISFIRI